MFLFVILFALPSDNAAAILSAACGFSVITSSYPPSFSSVFGGVYFTCLMVFLVFFFPTKSLPQLLRVGVVLDFVASEIFDLRVVLFFAAFSCDSYNYISTYTKRYQCN